MIVNNYWQTFLSVKKILLGSFPSIELPILILNNASYLVYIIGSDLFEDQSTDNQYAALIATIVILSETILMIIQDNMM